MGISLSTDAKHCSTLVIYGECSKCCSFSFYISLPDSK